jgi:hypothetical protein
VKAKITGDLEQEICLYPPVVASGMTLPGVSSQVGSPFDRQPQALVSGGEIVPLVVTHSYVVVGATTT